MFLLLTNESRVSVSPKHKQKGKDCLPHDSESIVNTQASKLSLPSNQARGMKQVLTRLVNNVDPYAGHPGIELGVPSAWEMTSSAPWFTHHLFFTRNIAWIVEFQFTNARRRKLALLTSMSRPSASPDRLASRVRSAAKR